MVKYELCQQFLESRVLVSQLVAGVDREPRGHSRNDGKRKDSPAAQVLRRGIPRRAQQCHEMQRHDDIGETTVVGIAVELHHDLLRRIVLVLTKDHVEDRRDTVIEQERQQQPEFVAGCRVQGNTRERL